mmetsp:Transcript_101485/g.326149  ORF Transcript_101485/g.326149 Transcript_101485/m.326149 type:complete len:507 (-) Transcript_101485:174-1694(-)
MGCTPAEKPSGRGRDSPDLALSQLEPRVRERLEWAERTARQCFFPDFGWRRQLVLLAVSGFPRTSELAALSSASRGMCRVMQNADVTAGLLRHVEGCIGAVRDHEAILHSRLVRLCEGLEAARARLLQCSRLEVWQLKKELPAAAVQSVFVPRSQGRAVNEAACLLLDGFVPDLSVMRRVAEEGRLLEKAACFDPKVLPPGRRRAFLERVSNDRPLLAAAAGRRPGGTFVDGEGVAVGALAAWLLAAGEVVEEGPDLEVMAQDRAVHVGRLLSLARWALRPSVGQLPEAAPTTTTLLAVGATASHARALVLQDRRVAALTADTDSVPQWLVLRPPPSPPPPNRPPCLGRPARCRYAEVPVPQATLEGAVDVPWPSLANDCVAAQQSGVEAPRLPNVSGAPRLRVTVPRSASAASMVDETPPASPLWVVEPSFGASATKGKGCSAAGDGQTTEVWPWPAPWAAGVVPAGPGASAVSALRRMKKTSAPSSCCSTTASERHISASSLSS